MLLSFAPIDLESATLYAGPCPNIPFPEILDHLNALFRGVLEPFRFCPVATGAAGAFVGSGLFVLVSKNSRPLGLQSLTQSLASPYTQMTFEDAATAVADHRSHIHITVTHDAPVETGGEPQAKLGVKRAPQADGLFDMKLAVCKLLTQYVCGRSYPTAIHWRQSNQILRPEQFLSLAATRALPMPLFLHPSYFTGAWTIAGRQVIGARACFAEHFLNCAVIFEETPMPPDWIFVRICEFVEAMRARAGQLTPDGGIFEANEAGTIRVRHAGPSDANPAGALHLTLESCAVHLPPTEARGFGQRLKRLFQ
ncbi:hypothetical protein [Methylocystis parvus]|uniref:hypothetical protein n=1 Tax=Methylocystis parvus TaxID=134 RepID=UPI003C71E1CE